MLTGKAIAITILVFFTILSYPLNHNRACVLCFTQIRSIKLTVTSYPQISSRFFNVDLGPEEQDWPIFVALQRVCM